MRVYDRGKKKMEDLIKELCQINPESGEKLATIVDEMFSGSLSDDKVNNFCFENYHPHHRTLNLYGLYLVFKIIFNC